MDFLKQEPTKQKGGPKRGWRCPENDPPEEDTRCEIVGKGGVMRSFYSEGRFYISADGKMVVSYANPEGWRPLP